MGITCSNCLNILTGIEYQQGQQNDNNHNQYTKQVFNCEMWNFYNLVWFKEYVQIVTMTNQNERKYYLDGQLLRIELGNNYTIGIQNFINLEQLKYLNWSGKYGQLNQKVGKWVTTWKGEILRDAGGWYSDDGKKQGLWIELTKNYRNKAEVQEFGYYQDDQRQGFWKYIYDDQLIDAGNYNYQGQKNGKWTQLSDRFCYYSQVIYKGEYKNGRKIGIWDIWYTEEDSYNHELIGGGQYDEDGNRIGKWIEQSEEFQAFSQVTYCGQYKSGKKIGRWDICFKDGYKDTKNIIGGGLYDEDGNKIGKWIELSEGFQAFSQVTYIGQYQKGNKIGRWDIFSFGEMIGGGSYDEVDSIKIGRWIEVSDFFALTWYVIYIGEYKNGKKVGRWDVEKRDQIGKPFYWIGGGLYDLEQGSIKIGKWFELNDHFHKNQYITTNGLYKNGNKIGKWESLWTTSSGQVNELIAYGSYDELNSNKFGKWIDISDTFSFISQVNYIGEYINGIKVGRWDIYFKKSFGDFKNELIGGGSYVEEQGSMKVGRWIELSHQFYSESQVTYIGDYKYGKKIGRWDIWYEQIYGDNRQQLVGGGQYDEEQGQIKIGRWMELSNNFDFYSQLTFGGEYKNSRKIGRWDIWFKNCINNQKNELIGGGSYNEEQGLNKFGSWIEVSDIFAANQQATLTGQYKFGRKVGIWKMNCKMYDEHYQVQKQIIFDY